MSSMTNKEMIMISLMFREEELFKGKLEADMAKMGIIILNIWDTAVQTVDLI